MNFDKIAPITSINLDRLFHGDIQNLAAQAQKSINEQNEGLVFNEDIGNTIDLQPSYIRLTMTTYSWNERFGKFWNIYGDFISLLGGGFAAGFSALLIDRFKIRSK